jgi:hypothetical protein
MGIMSCCTSNAIHSAVSPLAIAIHDGGAVH